MRKLKRGAVPPVLLEKQRQKQKNPNLGWGAVTPDEKALIWQELDQMQGGFCAYCECRLEQGKKHIEHFSQRSIDAGATFDWANLFGSCNCLDSCGKHKDERAAQWQQEDLLKPDQDNPEQFLRFFSDGAVRPRANLAPDQRRRAEETLRVFNLDATSHRLRDLRRGAIQGWLKSLQEVQEGWAGLVAAQLCTQDEAFAQVQEQFDDWLSEMRTPFATAIRHALFET